MGGAGAVQARTEAAVVTIIALKVAVLFALAWNTRFVMDEFAQLGWAKYLGNGLFETIWPAKTVGYAIFYKLAHLVGWDAVSILIAGRVQTALLACATLAVVYSIARSLGQDRLRALLIVLVLLCFSNFMERIFRTRAEPLAVFFAAASLLLVLRGKADSTRTVIAAGILSGLAFLTTQKSVYFNVALGIALVADAALAQRLAAGLARGAWLALGWLAPIVVYCFAFGNGDPLRVAENVVFGPVEVATQSAAVYGGLRHFVVQTLSRNAILYAFCFAGMIAALLQIPSLDQRKRIALIFSVIITVLVFAHDQPWPYVFVMALPFISLWSLRLLDPSVVDRRLLIVAWAVLGTAILASFVKNVAYFGHDNRRQLELVERAESLLHPGEAYFDGIGMLPNRPEPSTLWLDKLYVQKTLRDRENSEAYRVLSVSPPKLILWSYRMDAIEPVVAPLIRDSYVKIGPNLMLAGRHLTPGVPVAFDVPVAGTYRLYDASGEPAEGRIQAERAVHGSAIRLPAGRTKILLRIGPRAAFLLPEGARPGRLEPDARDYPLFAGVYG